MIIRIFIAIVLLLSVAGTVIEKFFGKKAADTYIDYVGYARAALIIRFIISIFK